jgi:hypothetical protein
MKINLDEYAKRLDRRKAELGFDTDDYVMKNSGISRTEYKRALLRYIYEQCKLKGREPPFKANF